MARETCSLTRDATWSSEPRWSWVCPRRPRRTWVAWEARGALDLFELYELRHELAMFAAESDL